MEAEVLRQEALLGENDALIGQRWLELSRACQAEDPHTYAEKAEHALVKSGFQLSDLISFGLTNCQGPAMGLLR